jgi:hypothetical protein
VIALWTIAGGMVGWLGIQLLSQTVGARATLGAMCFAAFIGALTAYTIITQ